MTLFNNNTWMSWPQVGVLARVPKISTLQPEFYPAQGPIA